MDNKSFIELYKEEKRKLTPAQEFIRKVAEMTKRSESAVRFWVIGINEPDALCKSIISEKFGIDENVLFPAQQKKN